MKFALSRPTSIDEEAVLFENYRPIGYDGLQLKRSQYAPYLERPEAFLERWGGYSDAASALIAHGPLDDEHIEQLRKLYAFAGKAGTERIVFCHAVPRSGVRNEDIVRFASKLSEAGKEAEQHGVRLSLHHHYGHPVMYRNDFDLFFEHVRDESVGLTVDTAHLKKSGIDDIAEVIRSFGGVIDNFHLKDYSRGDWKVLGEGDIDFEPIFQAMKDIGYDGWVSADEESGDEVVRGMRSCLAFMKQGLANN